MKIALVCGHFVPSLGYAEVYLARAWHQLGHEVCVFTTAEVPAYVRNHTDESFEIGVSNNEGFTVNRLPVNFSKGQMVRSKQLQSAVQSWQPEHVIVIGLGKLFPLPLLQANRDYKLSVLLGDNAASYEKQSQKGLAQKLKLWLKKRVYNRAAACADHFFPYTPESLIAAQKLISSRWHARTNDRQTAISLGFDREQFHYDASGRKSIRQELQIADSATVVITATRVIPEKRFESIIELINRRNEQGEDIHYLLLGWQDDEYGQEIQSFVATLKHRSKIHLRAFAPHHELKKYYSAGDIAYFPSAVISIFEALGTGLPVVIPDIPALSHIIEEKTDGRYFPNGQPEAALEECISILPKLPPRKDRQERQIARFEWEAIARKIVEAEAGNN